MGAAVVVGATVVVVAAVVGGGAVVVVAAVVGGGVVVVVAAVVGGGTVVVDVLPKLIVVVGVLPKLIVVVGVVVAVVVVAGAAVVVAAAVVADMAAGATAAVSGGCPLHVLSIDSRADSSEEVTVRPHRTLMSIHLSAYWHQYDESDGFQSSGPRGRSAACLDTLVPLATAMRCCGSTRSL